MIYQTKTIQIGTYIHLLGDLLIRQTLFHQILEKIQFAKLSHYTVDAITYKQQSTCSYNLLMRTLVSVSTWNCYGSDLAICTKPKPNIYDIHYF